MPLTGFRWSRSSLALRPSVTKLLRHAQLRDGSVPGTGVRNPGNRTALPDIATAPEWSRIGGRGTTTRFRGENKGERDGDGWLGSATTDTAAQISAMICKPLWVRVNVGVTHVQEPAGAGPAPGLPEILNARLLAEELRVAVEVDRAENGSFLRESLRKAIDSVMDPNVDVGKTVRENHTRWRETLAAADFMSGYVDEFIHKLRTILRPA